MNELVKKEIDCFNESMLELEHCNFMLAERKVTGVLQAIIKSQFLQKLIKRCADGFSYEEEWNKCFSLQRSGEVYGSNVVLPADPGKKVALVCNLLMNIDDKRIDLCRFLSDYFPGDGSYFESYTAFSAEVLDPFRVALREIAVAVCEGAEEKQEKADLVPQKNNHLEELSALLREDKKLIRLCAQKHPEAKDAEELSDALYAAVETGEKEFVRLMFLGYKYAMQAFRLKGNQKKEEAFLKKQELL